MVFFVHEVAMGGKADPMATGVARSGRPVDCAPADPGCALHCRAMGKIDDMRRHREALFAAREARAAAPPDDAVAEPAPEPAPEVTVAAARRTRRLGAGRSAAASEEGACSVCGKVRPVHAGIVAVHQKGLGSVCPGSRKPAA
jgi:hypothetical protein